MSELINLPEVLGIEPKHVWFMIGCLAVTIASERYDEYKMRKERDAKHGKMD